MTDALSQAMLDGAANALRNRAARLREKAERGIFFAEKDFGGRTLAVRIWSPESRVASNLADAFDRIAAEFRAELCA